MISDKNKSAEKSSHSWVLVVFLLIIFWPVGVYFLVKKLSTDKKATLSTGKSMIVWGWIIAGMGIISWPALIEDGFFSGTLGMLFFASAGFSLVYIGRRTARKASRYKKYINLIVNKRVKSIGTISSAISVPHDTAVNDIEEMINKGFFEDFYIDYSSDEIILLNKNDVEFNLNNEEVEMILVTCSGCGANNKVKKMQIDNCQYCGSLISAKQ